MTHRTARRKGYEWPQVDIVHPDHGSYRFAIHGIRAPGGCITLMAFHGTPAADQTAMAGIVFEAARGLHDQVVALEADDISEDLGIFLAAKAHASPGTGILVVPGGEWGVCDHGHHN